jgi:hypothetical protein
MDRGDIEGLVELRFESDTIALSPVEYHEIVSDFVADGFGALASMLKFLVKRWRRSGPVSTGAK